MSKIYIMLNPMISDSITTITRLDIDAIIRINADIAIANTIVLALLLVRVVIVLS